MAVEEAAREAGLKIEIAPSMIHQEDLGEIYKGTRQGARALEGGCGCFARFDALVRFSEGSYRRPDISIFCTRPPRLRAVATQVPTAVVEALSPSSMVKDTVLSPIDTCRRACATCSSTIPRASPWTTSAPRAGSATPCRSSWRRNRDASSASPSRRRISLVLVTGRRAVRHGFL